MHSELTSRHQDTKEVFIILLKNISIRSFQKKKDFTIQKFCLQKFFLFLQFKKISLVFFLITDKLSLMGKSSDIRDRDGDRYFQSGQTLDQGQDSPVIFCPGPALPRDNDTGEPRENLSRLRLSHRLISRSRSHVTQ